MTIHHHISDELMLEYASGSLQEGWSIAVATHMALCPECRRRLSQMEAAAGLLVEAIEAEPASAQDNASWAALKQRLSETPAPARGKAQPVRLPEGRNVPEPLRSYLGGSLDTVRWRALGLGAYHHPIRTSDASTSVRLLRIPAGKPVPEHGHRGRELTLVLCGAFRDENGLFGVGDFEETDAEVEHQPIAEPGEDCICLAVTDAPLKFRSRIVRIIQPLLGI